MNIAGHAAVVTGAGSGLGAQTAACLAKAGAKVGVLDINLEAARKVASAIGGVAAHCDVTDAASATQALAAICERHGAARILVNCAGIAPAKRIVGRDGPMPLAEFERVIQVNLIGSFNMMRLVGAN